MTISLPTQTARLVDKETKKLGMVSRSEFLRKILRGYFEERLQSNIFEARPLEEIKRQLTQRKKYNPRFIKSVVNGLAKSSLYANHQTASQRS